MPDSKREGQKLIVPLCCALGAKPVELRDEAQGLDMLQAAANTVPEEAVIATAVYV